MDKVMYLLDTKGKTMEMEITIGSVIIKYSYI